MKEHTELKKVVIAKLSHSNFPQTASEMYYEIRHEFPKITRVYEFKSFVKLINCFPEVQPIKECSGKASVYKVKV
jgi:hypothetical protein